MVVVTSITLKIPSTSEIACTRQPSRRPDTPSALKQIRRSSWKFQQTFKTPLKNLQPFVAAILSTASPETACITIEHAVFEPKHWIDLLTRYSLPQHCGKEVSVTAVGRQEMEELLHTAFSDWFDFLFVPTRKRFVIYADHDEYIRLCQHSIKPQSCCRGSVSGRILKNCRLRATSRSRLKGQLLKYPHCIHW
jgi:hypothetical protein